MKSKLLLMISVMFVMSIFLISSVSAIGNIATFEKDYTDNNGNHYAYGHYKIKNNWDIPLISSVIAEYDLIENSEECLLDCFANGKVVLYSPGKLFDNVDFKDRIDKTIEVNYGIYLKETEIYLDEVSMYGEKDVCKLNDVGDEECSREFLGRENVTKTKEIWKEYDGRELEPGNYEWKLEGNKKQIGAVDWVANMDGIEFSEWAWWNSSWSKKASVTITSPINTTNYAVRLNITYDSDMQSDFDDLRFANSTENGELKYWIENKSDGVYAIVWVQNPILVSGNNTIYMYYKNTGASSSSNIHLVSNWNVSTAIYNQTLTVTAREDNVADLYLKPDGTKLYICGGSDSVNQYGLSTPWAISTGTWQTSKAINAQGVTNNGIFFKEDGLKMYIADRGTEKILQYNLGTAWNVSTAGFNSQLITTITTLQSLFFSPDGTMMFMSTDGSQVFKYNLSTAWDVTTAVYNSNKTGFGDSRAIHFSPDGTIMYVSDMSTDEIVQFLLTPAWNITSATEVSTKVVTQDGAQLGIFFSPDGSKMYFAGANYDGIYQFNLNASNFTYYMGSELNDRTATINSPIDNYNSTTATNNFNCSAIGSSLTNISVWTNASGGWAINKTNTVTGNANTTIVSVGLPQGTLLWTCHACDNGGCSFASENRTINVDSLGPALQITYPTATTYSANIIIFNWTVTDAHLDTCLYNIDTGANITVNCSTGYNTTNLGSGAHTIRMYANDTFGNINSSIVSFTIDTDYPTIVLNSPIDNFKSTSSAIVFNCTGTDNLNLANVSLYIDDILNATNNPANDTSTTFSKTLIDGAHTWNCQACDNLVNCVNGSARNLLVDTINPGVEIIYPTAINYSIVVTTFNTTQVDTNLDICWYSLNNGATNTTFTCNTNITGLVANQGVNTWKVWANDTVGRVNGSSVTFNVSSAPVINIQSPSGFLGLKTINYSVDLNYTATDPYLSSCWYSIDSGANISLPGCNNQTIIITDLVPLHSIVVYANDTFGNVGSDSSSWQIFTDNGVTYSSSVVTGDLTTFTANFSTSIAPTTVILTYNNVNYTPSVVVDGYDYILTNNLNALNVTVDTNVTFYYTFVIDGNTIVLDSRNQTVQAIAILTNEACTNSTFLILNITNYGEQDSELLISINGTVDYNFNIMNGGMLVAQANGISNGSNIRICSNHNLSASTGIINLQLRYYKDGYMYKTYNIQDGVLTSIPFSINLYFLNNTMGTKFIINYVDFNYFTHPGALIQIQRQYLSDNTYKVVEIPLTNDDGSSQGSFDTNNIRYKLIVIDDGVILDTFNNVFPICQNIILGTCVLDLRGVEVQTTETINDFTYTLEKSNNSITLTYVIPSGTPRSVTFSTHQNSRFLNNISTCNTTLFASGGTIICGYNNTVGDSILDTQITISDLPTLYGSVHISEDLSGFYMLNNYVIGFVLLLSLALIFIASGVMIVIVAVVGLMFLGVIFLLRGFDLTTIASSIIWLVISAIIIIYKISQKEERT